MSETQVRPVKVDDAIAQTYGWQALDDFHYLRHGYPNLSDSEAWLRFMAEPKPTHTAFFREFAMTVFAEELAAGMQESLARPLEIAEVGCGTGEESWTLAALLEANSIEGHVHAFDVNERAIARARKRGPYEDGYGTTLEHSIGKLRSARYLPFFERTGGYVVPIPVISNRVDFQQLDIITNSLQPQSYDVVVANNLLWHYPESTREQMLKNMLNGLREGGLFIFEGTMPNGQYPRDYPNWASSLNRYSLQPHPSIGTWLSSRVLIYEPSNLQGPQETLVERMK
jgi:chemotaxis methyl-accepting protein methylase